MENINGQIRKFSPKCQSVDKYSKKDIKQINKTLLNTPIRSLDGNTPSDAFKVVYGEDIYCKLLDIVNDECKWVYLDHWQYNKIKIFMQIKFIFICYQ